MDDETAEVELLEQNLNKTRQISQRMTSILTSFDSRLVKLEKSILPLYTSTGVLTKRGKNIESALQRIDEVASNQEGIAAEEASILRGPQPKQLEAYIDVLERLNASIAFGSPVGSQRDTARLVETGTKKLAQLFTKVVASGSSGNPPAGSEFQYSLFPRDELAALQPLVKFLRSLPLPATHPSHPAAAAILSALKEAQRGYAEMRGSWGRKCLELYGRRVVDRAETTDGVSAGRELGKFTSDLLGVIEEEYSLLIQLAPLPGQSHFTFAYITLLTPLTALFNTTLSSLSTLIKRSLHKFTFHALAYYSALFPEFLADIKLAGLGKGGEIGTGCADYTITTTRYLEQLLEVRDAVGPTLMLLGDGNWKMGDGVLIEHYTYDVVKTLLASLSALSRLQRRPAFGSTRAPVLEILSRPTQDVIYSNFRTAKAGYFDSNFSPLVQALAEDKEKPGGGKTVAKEKFTRFFDLLDETKERHQLARVLEDEDEEREMLADEVVKLVVPSSSGSRRRCERKSSVRTGALDSPPTDIKMTPEEVDAQIRSFY
ncbi:Cullin repeat-like-containing domain protein [Russula brevipes]|nr:Cullin repeat-like-containing domain protein [Russula brevipes]